MLLIRVETSSEDVHGLLAAEGVLTSRGGLVSHAAVDAQGWENPSWSVWRRWWWVRILP
ncbi:MAG: PEP-utilizing enzyme [Ferrimicrobium sp.]